MSTYRRRSFRVTKDLHNCNLQAVNVGAQQLKARGAAAGAGRGARRPKVHLTPPRGIVHGGLIPSVKRVEGSEPVAVQQRPKAHKKIFDAQLEH